MVKVTSESVELVSENNARIGADRRNNNLRSFFYSFYKRRRQNIRRTTDLSTNVYVDIHDKSTVFLFTSILIFCVADALLTLFILQSGGREVNPFMNYLLGKDVMMFFWVKFTLTSIGMLFLVSHKYFVFYRICQGGHIIKLIFAMYFTLIIYEIFIISKYAA